MSVITLNSIIKLDTIDSTNNYAIRNLMNNQWIEGTVIIANEQTTGKGQKNNRWESENGKNLLFSVILYPNFIDVQYQFEISKVVALAVSDVVSQIVGQASIKWPNDIYVGDKKICGILIENAIMGNTLSQSIVGVGLNVNQTVFISDAPNPISLSLIKDCYFNLDELLNSFMLSLDYWYEKLKTDSFELIDQTFLKRLYQFQSVKNYKDSEGIFTGTIQGINQYGQLIIHKMDGTDKAYSFKEITYL